MAIFDAKPGTAYDWAGRYSIAPSTRAPIVREWHREGELHRDVDEARWGLRPPLRNDRFRGDPRRCRLGCDTPVWGAPKTSSRNPIDEKPWTRRFRSVRGRV